VLLQKLKIFIKSQNISINSGLKMEKMKKERDSYVFSSRTFEGFCKDNNITKDEGRKALFN
jgi:hypothetical protein